MNDSEPRLDVPADDAGPAPELTYDKAYWRSRTPAERIQHVEVLRRLKYGEAALGPMQKVLEIVPFPPPDDS